MKKINFLIIGPDTENTSDLATEIKKRNHAFLAVPMKKIFFEFSNNVFSVKWKNKNLKNFDIVLFRGYNENFIEAQILAKKFLDAKIIIIDESLGKGFVPGKIFEASQLVKNKINHPKTFQALDISSYGKILKNINFPIIVKPVRGQKGKDMYKFNSQRKALNFFKKNERGYLIQEYLPIDGDIRVFVVGNKVIGAIKRFVIKGDFRSNASLGATAEKYTVDEKLKKLALSAAKIMRYEIAGVDVISHKGEYFVLEVNFAPQWQKFKEITGINPAKHIIDYAIQKYEKNKARLL
ncbi:RimK family alpha-L-glutamate ligase [Patescibacteria group bacterium]|nr:RimK family alpha-L-glutamate ligase [Patescibacteria group bacterium]